jgi:hypothetical protein
MKTNRIPRIAPGFLIATVRIFRGLESSKMVVRERPKKPLSGLWHPAPFFRFYVLRKIYFDHRSRGIVDVLRCCRESRARSPHSKGGHAEALFSDCFRFRLVSLKMLRRLFRRRCAAFHAEKS